MPVRPNQGGSFDSPLLKKILDNVMNITAILRTKSYIIVALQEIAFIIMN